MIYPDLFPGGSDQQKLHVFCMVDVAGHQQVEEPVSLSPKGAGGGD